MGSTKKWVKLVLDKFLTFLLPSKFYFLHIGYCSCCDKNVTFRSTNSWLRDNFFCTNCYSIPRERALMLTIEKYFPNWKELEIHECSPIEKGASLKIRNGCEKYIATQYHPDIAFGTMVNDYRNEDLENQTFDDESFDIIVTQDVMEHIYNPEKAFSEIARTLKKGGAHIFTVPIINKHKKSEIWSAKDDKGEPIFLKNPEYHYNPVSKKGSPVTMHWGFDIVDFIKDKSGLETYIEYIDDLDYGIRAEFIEVLVSIKK